jgi:predicted phage tail protein
MNAESITDRTRKAKRKMKMKRICRASLIIAAFFMAVGLGAVLASTGGTLGDEFFRVRQSRNEKKLLETVPKKLISH